MPAQPVADPSRPPPIEYTVAVWLGMPDADIARGLREGWIRAPQAAVPTMPIGSSLSHAEAGEPVVDRARVEALVRRLDASLDAATFDAAWNEAGTDEASRAARFSEFLGRALGVADPSVSRFALIEAVAGDASGDARLLRLSGRTGGELEALARVDAGVRRSLAQHAPWALVGDRSLSTLADPGGRYDRFDRDSGEALLSDDWIGDRARHAAWRAAASADEPARVSGPAWRFVDRANPSADVEIDGEGEDVHQVIFARDGGDRVSGGASTDRIHGGDGSDVLLGRGGNDLLEGSSGDDTMFGGAGRDVLVGQQGDDEIDGGAGGDRLDGGSGNDDVSGGRGDDLLRGGIGRDRYRFEAGDGNDVIEDADGGEIVVDDVVVAGAMRRSDDGWISADGRLSFGLQGTTDAGGTLSIRRNGDDGGDAVTIHGWRQSAFGFSLADGDDVPDPERDARHAQGDSAAFGDEDPEEVTGSDVSGVDSGEGGSTPDAPAGPDAVDADIDALIQRSADEGSGWVDFGSLTAAFDAWSIPAPPDVAAAQLHDAHAVTTTAIAHALAGGEAFDDADAGTMAIEVGPMSLPVPADVLGPSPPPLLLRNGA